MIHIITQYVDDTARRIDAVIPLGEGDPQFVGHGVVPVATTPNVPPRPMPIRFPIHADDVEDAFEKMDAVMHAHVTKLRAEAHASKIVTARQVPGPRK